MRYPGDPGRRRFFRGECDGRDHPGRGERHGGDDGPATDAQLHEAAGVAVTAEGGFLIADTGSSEVLKVAAS